MQVTYQRKRGKQLVYEIRSDKWGAYEIRLDGRTIKTVAIGDHFGRSRFGSKKLEAQGIEAGKAAVENLMTDEG